MLLRNGESCTVGGGGLKCSWEVLAGVIPGKPMPVYGRVWHLGSYVWEQDLQDSAAIRSLNEVDYKLWLAAGNKADSSFQVLSDVAYHYAKQLGDPKYVNWVRVEFIWY